MIVINPVLLQTTPTHYVIKTDVQVKLVKRYADGFGETGCAAYEIMSGEHIGKYTQLFEHEVKELK
jgi:hypothetical protein